MKMSKKKIVLSGCIAVAILFVLLLVFGQWGEDKNTKKVSLIVFGADTARWENLRQGVEDTCEDMNAELSMVNTISNDPAAEQIELIQRELAGGADALLIVPADSERIGDYLNSNKPGVPVIFLENTTTYTGNSYYVGVDDLEMGRALGTQIIERENPIVKVAIISDGTERSSVKAREQGVREIIEPYAGQVVTWARKDNEKNLSTRKFLQRAMLEEAVDVVVALDNDTADALMDALDNLNRQTKVYVISTSEESVYYLDQKRIKTMVYQTEYSIGYIAASYGLNAGYARNGYGMNNVTYHIVDRDNMYEKENQKFIFPFVR